LPKFERDSSADAHKGLILEEKDHTQRFKRIGRMHLALLKVVLILTVLGKPGGEKLLKQCLQML